MLAGCEGNRRWFWNSHQTRYSNRLAKKTRQTLLARAHTKRDDDDDENAK
jgi:hypothetical protein